MVGLSLDAVARECHDEHAVLLDVALEVLERPEYGSPRRLVGRVRVVRGQKDYVLEARVLPERLGYCLGVVGRAPELRDVGVGRVLVYADNNRVALGLVGQYRDGRVFRVSYALCVGLLILRARGRERGQKEERESIREQAGEPAGVGGIT